MTLNGTRTRTAVIVVVTAAWVANFALGALWEEYDPSEAVNGVFLIVVGYLFTTGAKKDKEQ